MYVTLTPIIIKKKVYKKYLITIQREQAPWQKNPLPFISAFFSFFILKEQGLVLCNFNHLKHI